MVGAARARSGLVIVDGWVGGVSSCDKVADDQARSCLPDTQRDNFRLSEQTYGTKFLLDSAGKNDVVFMAVPD